MPLLRLTPLFTQFATLLRPTAIEPARGSGFSGAEIFRVATPLGPCALRCWPAEHPSLGHLRVIHRLLSKSFESGCTFVPRPIASLAGSTILEFEARRWQLEPWMPGEPDHASAPRPQRIEAAIVALKRLHAAFAPEGSLPQRLEPSPALRERIRVLQGCLAGDMHQVRASLQLETSSPWQERARRYFTIFDRAVATVDDLLHRAAAYNYFLQPVVRDVHREHILFSGDEVTGIVDYGALTVDHPAIDLARLLGSFEVDAPDDRESLLDLYSPQLMAEERLAVDAFDLSGALLSPFRWLWWLYVEHRTFRDADAVARRFDVLLQRLTRLFEGDAPGHDFSLPSEPRP